MTLLGIYNGNSSRNVLNFEHWLGRKIDFHSQHTGDASWKDFDESIGWSIGLYNSLKLPIFWSVPLLPHGATLHEAAAGAYNGHYTSAAKMIAARRVEPILYVRTGWEQNGDWMTWAAKGKENEFIGSFVQFSNCFRSVSPRFHLVWCPNVGQHDPALSYPGDEHLDVIGLDFYHNPKWDPPKAIEAWNFMVGRQFGLQWHLEFARSHAKPIAYPEWGVQSDNFGPYISNMARWCHASHALYQCYWNSNSAYPGELSGGQYPKTGEIFRSVFREDESPN